MTQLVSLACDHCGAPLSIPNDVRFVTCAHCQTSLAIEHTESASFTRQLAELSEKTAAIDDKLNSVHREMERQRLDRQWDVDSKRLLIRRKDGRETVPKRMDSPGSVVQLLVAIGFLCFFAFVSFQIPNEMRYLFLGFSVVAGFVVIFQTAREHDKAIKYERARRRYRDAKAKLSE